MLRRKRSILLFIGILGIIFSLLQLRLNNYDESRLSDVETPIVIWWTPFVHYNKYARVCGDVQCYFTQNRTFQSHPLLKGILFYGSNFQINDLPLPRRQRVDWGLFHEESPRNNPILVHEQALNLFNYSATFSRYSDIPLTLLHLPSEQELMDEKYFIPFKEKRRLMATKNLAPVLYIQSDCDTATERDSYVSELMKHIRVDSYGPCLNNRELPRSLKENHLDKLESEEFLSFVAQYKFTLAIENAACFDYLTEKFWRPLIVGSVPVYYGSPSFMDWVPNNKSVISVADFLQPKDLAEHLVNLTNDELQYERYITHKLYPSNFRITNARLLTALRDRSSSMPHDFVNYVRSFECFVCKKLHDPNRMKNVHIVNTKHFNCPLPRSPLTGEVNKNNWWVDRWNLEKCSAKLLVQKIMNNVLIDMNQFDEERFKMYVTKNC
ncbi:alpha-(1,3)-fucosyltransferase 10 [Orussus abietinus]|uniref:alpha-(1,3)-fucosyltransferase 10 n=1 Tax=Orussus abietinus TaxID=222816 RepID=UPI0006259B04|nr:alpha-(1,3)-fucosyltransferase 10 [Orussus abietinus]